MPDLTATLTRLLEDCRRNPGAAIRTELSRGLQVHVRTRAGRFSLAISRKAPTRPSLHEWQTVLAKLPQPLPDPGEPVFAEAHGRLYLGATWPVDELVRIGGA